MKKPKLWLITFIPASHKEERGFFSEEDEMFKVATTPTPPTCGFCNLTLKRGSNRLFCCHCEPEVAKINAAQEKLLRTAIERSLT